MAKDRSRFVCQACGAVSPKWQGRCDACGEWNTLIEETTAPRGPGPAAKTAGGRRVEFVGLKGESAPPPRIAAQQASNQAKPASKRNTAAGQPLS